MKKKKWWVTDTAFKIYSVLFAILFWLFVIFDQNPESTKVIRKVPIYYSNLEALEREGYTFLNEGDKFVDVKIKGKRLALAKLSKQNVSAFVSFNDFKEGEQEFNIDVKLSAGDMYVEDKSPYALSMKIEKKVFKELEIEVLYSGENLVGQIASGELDTNTVTVSGPESVINTVSSAKIFLSYEEVRGSETGTSDIVILDSEGNDITNDINIDLSSSYVNWTRNIYNVKDASIDIVFENSDDYAIEELKLASSAVVLCAEDASKLEIENVKTLPVSDEDVNKIKNGENIDVVLKLPSSVHILRQDSKGRWKIDETDTVQISGKVLHLEKIPLTHQKIEFINQNDTLEYQLLSIPSDISVKCKDELTDALWNTIFKIDVSNFGEGEHEVWIEADLPDGAQFVSENKAKIKITKKTML